MVVNLSKVVKTIHSRFIQVSTNSKQTTTKKINFNQGKNTFNKVETKTSGLENCTNASQFCKMTGGTSEKTHCFKTENKFIVKSGCKKRMWRSLKQILTAERVLPWPNDAVLYYSINAPPTFKPTKKYSDISGLPAPYMDRHSKLFYSNCEEFATVRSLPMDITAGYLQLRGANTIVG